ncbi:NUDIX domain-containing protein [Kitasatospora viridis]|uniref:NUDIX domain-containing protein n=1 Tax=Kitasatospora viridis TaxID=281105 RepID=A0A561TVY7_9ACTN|nr:NUDIX domain-containing protein [Kitasatospora viridis]TWF91270.1 NUDIX domain-containing protein [Kitasatospora viridis]
MKDFKSGNAIITTPDGMVLLHLRAEDDRISFPGHWSVPGGFPNPGETPYETTRRELREETGLDVEGLLPFEVIYHPDDDPRRRFFHAVVDVDPAELVLGEGQELRLVALAEAQSMKVPPAIKDYLRQLEGHLRIGKPRVWASIDRLHRRLSEHNGADGDFLAYQVLKVQEEAGEAAQALLGVRGANPYKGFSHTMDDLQGELCDVIAAAMVALRATTPDAASLLSEHVARWER